MESRVAVIGIIIEDDSSIEMLNNLLHKYSEYIIGRMGIPYREKKVNIMSIVIDAPQDKTSALTGNIGRLKGISVKTAYSSIISKN